MSKPTIALCRALSVLALWICGQAIAREPPDLQGMWTGGTLTPLERPPQLANKAFLAKEEMAAHQQESTERFWKAGHNPADVGRDNDAFIDGGMKVLPSGQTSLVVYPADGKVPLLPEAEQRRDFNLANLDSYETMSQWDRCITRAPMALMPVIYNNAYQIIQTPSEVVIVAEMIHDVRVIPLDAGPHAPASVRSWSGDARGHWEGDTLVVDTTNFNDRGWILTAGNAGRMRGVPYTTNLHIVERFTRVDAKTLNYEMTVEDPAVYREPWKVSFAWTRDDTYQMFEYACHEGNQAIGLILGGARVQEQEAAAH